MNSMTRKFEQVMENVTLVFDQIKKPTNVKLNRAGRRGQR